MPSTMMPNPKGPEGPPPLPPPGRSEARVGLVLCDCIVLCSLEQVDGTWPRTRRFFLSFPRRFGGVVSWLLLLLLPTSLPAPLRRGGVMHPPPPSFSFPRCFGEAVSCILLLLLLLLLLKIASGMATSSSPSQLHAPEHLGG